jgi:hypothetical protein
MIVEYSPSSEETKTWPYKAEELPSQDAEDIEEVLGLTFDEFQSALTAGKTKPRRALLWVLLRRDDASLKFDDVSFKLGELVIKFDSDELKRIREIIEADTTLDAETKKAALSAFDEEDAPPAPKAQKRAPSKS